jgi:SAM-dependent methyltransferase
MRNKRKGVDKGITEEHRKQYEIETKMATALMSATAEERRTLYTTLYDELYRLVPNHPQHRLKQSPIKSRIAVDKKLKLIKHYLDGVESFLEVGPGDCALAFRVAEIVKEVYAVDVSQEITRGKAWPSNFQLYISDGSSIPLPNHKIDLVYSNQLMEHLHPEDAYQQVKNIYQVLREGGKYICITPNSLSGPHDISIFYNDVSAGLHLKEYTIKELSALFREIGFSKVHLYAGGKGWYFRCPLWMSAFLERVLAYFRPNCRKSLARFIPVKAILGINMVGVK